MGTKARELESQGMHILFSAEEAIGETISFPSSIFTFTVDILCVDYLDVYTHL